MIKPLNGAFFPFAVNILCGVKICFVSVIAGEADIIFSVIVSYTSCPHSLTVNISLLQSLSGSIIKGIADIYGVFPVYKIIGTENFTAREEMHCSRDHIVCIAHPYNIGVGIIERYDRIYFFIFQNDSPSVYRLEPVFTRNVCGFSSIILSKTRQKSAGGLAARQGFLILRTN